MHLQNRLLFLLLVGSLVCRGNAFFNFDSFDFEEKGEDLLNQVLDQLDEETTTTTAKATTTTTKTTPTTTTTSTTTTTTTTTPKPTTTSTTTTTTEQPTTTTTAITSAATASAVRNVEQSIEEAENTCEQLEEGDRAELTGKTEGGFNCAKILESKRKRQRLGQKQLEENRIKGNERLSSFYFFCLHFFSSFLALRDKKRTVCQKVPERLFSKVLERSNGLLNCEVVMNEMESENRRNRLIGAMSRSGGFPIAPPPLPPVNPPQPPPPAPVADQEEEEEEEEENELSKIESLCLKFTPAQRKAVLIKSKGRVNCDEIAEAVRQRQLNDNHDDFNDFNSSPFNAYQGVHGNRGLGLGYKVRRYYE